MSELDFYKGRRVLITGHSGFKGSWLCLLLNRLGASIYGYSLQPEEGSLFCLSGCEDIVHSCYGDIRDFERLKACFEEASPEIVIHMAAQAIVWKGYEEPRYTYDVNIMGTVNVLECLRDCQSVRSFINVTTDKVYQKSDGSTHGEEDILNGYDPYSNSKSCSELVSQTYARHYLQGRVASSNLRSGNAIGGGDMSAHRIVPDCFRAYLNDDDVIIRNPRSIRPYQHVLNVLHAYLLVAMKQYEDDAYSGSYNIGPDLKDYVDNEELVRRLLLKLRERDGIVPGYGFGDESLIGEEDRLYIDVSRFDRIFNRSACWDLEKSLDEIAEFFYRYKNHLDLKEHLDDRIGAFLNVL